MKRVNAASSRGCKTTAPDTVAVGETAPSCFAPRGISGLGARTRVPVGAAAPAPAAEIAKHTSAPTGAATNARPPTTFLMYALLNERQLPPLGAAPIRPCQLRRDDNSDVSGRYRWPKWWARGR